jgi:hypothetical protein
MRNDPQTSTASERTIGSTTRRRVLRGGLGAAAAAVAVPALSGVAAAHFPPELDIDVQPENAENFIDLGAHESVTVAVHSSEFLSSGERETFAPTEAGVRYRFGAARTLRDGAGARPLGEGEATESGDGEALVLEFPVADTGFDGGEETAWLYWERDESGGHGYAGFDHVRVYGETVSDRDLLTLLRELLGDRADG